ncbi:lonely Cys domain-containing protein, partial [Streptomyces albus]
TTPDADPGPAPAQAAETVSRDVPPTSDTLPAQDTRPAQDTPPAEDTPAAKDVPAPAVSVDPVAELASRLPTMAKADRARELSLLPPADRERLASDPALVEALRQTLRPADFAETAAQLMVQVPAGVDQPVSARHEVQAQVARMLRDPDVAANLLKEGARVAVVPKGEALTTLDAFRHLAGARSPDGRPWEEVRGAATRTAGVTEENLLGEVTSVRTERRSQPEGYSSTTHEVAHLVHQYGLTDADKQLVHDIYQAKLGQGDAAVWPDGPLHDPSGKRRKPNYSSLNEYEFFAQLTNAYLGTNAGRDGYTRQWRNNGAAWVRQHEKALLPLLERLYGPDPEAVHARPANQLAGPRKENWVFEGFRAFWDRAEGTHQPQPHALAPVPEPDAVPGATAATADATPADTTATNALPSPPANRRDGEQHLESISRNTFGADAASDPSSTADTTPAAPALSAPLSPAGVTALAARLDADRVRTVPVGDPPAAPAPAAQTAPPAATTQQAGTTQQAATAQQAATMQEAATTQQAATTPLAAPPAASPSSGPSVLPTSDMVTFDGQSATVSPAREAAVERLAFRTAQTGVRNKRAWLSKSPVVITAHGTGPLAQQRADAVAALFRHHLGRALTTLGAGTKGPTVDDFPVTVELGGRAPQGATEGPVTVQVAIDPLSAPVLHLEELGKAEYGSGIFRPDRLVRRVLGLGDGAPLSRAMRRNLYTFVGLAMMNGRAGSLAELTAYYAEREAALFSERRHSTADGTPAPGLNWTDLPAKPLYTGTVGLLQERPDGAYPDILSSTPPRWAKGPKPYLLGASMRDGRVSVPAPHGGMRGMGAEQFVERVLQDPELAALPADAPIVLAVPFAGDGDQYLARLLADRTGRTVWAHSGDARLTVTSDGERLALAVFKESGRPVGDWFAVQPGMLPDSDSDESWFDEVASSPLASATTGLQIGRTSFPPHEMAVREEAYRFLDRITQYVHYNFATGTFSKEFTLEPASRGRIKAFFAAHGGAGSTSFATRGGGTHRARGGAGAKWLKKSKSFGNLLRTKDDWLGLVTCQSGSGGDSALPPRSGYGRNNPGAFTPNPLRDIPEGQHYANEMRHKVSAATVRSAVSVVNGKHVRVLVTDPRGRWGSYGEFFPEPETAELDRRARVVGLHAGTGPASAEARLRTLDLVRALRMTLGNEIDDDVHVDADPGYAQLLRGAGALERMWREDPRFAQAGPFTLDLFRRAVVAELPSGRTEPRRDDFRALLSEAAVAPRRTKLADFVTLPGSLGRAAAWLSGADAAQETADLLRLSGPDQVGEDERSRMFWARVKAEEALDALGSGLDAYTARVLHLDPSAVDDAARERARTLTAHAYAVGRDGAVPDEVAAYHLETEGALSEATRIPPSAPGSSGGGRNLLGTRAGNATVDLSKVHVPGGTVDAPWHGKTGGTTSPDPYVIRAELDRTDAGHLFVTYGGVTRRIPAGEFIELAANDPELLVLDPAVPVFLAVSELDRFAPGVADDLAQRIGRGVYSTEFPLGEHTDGGTAPVFSLHPSPVTGASPTAAALRRSGARTLEQVRIPPPVSLPLDAEPSSSSRPTVVVDPPRPATGDGTPLFDTTPSAL